MLQRILENHIGDDSDATLSRRKFLKNLAYGAVLTLSTPALAQAASHAAIHPAKTRYPANRTLALVNPNTGDKLKLTYFEKGHYIKPALREINYVLRDYRTGDIHPIDPYLLDQLHDLRLSLGIAHRPFHIISGYRSPHTNSLLHHESHGVSNNSLHMQGRAIDVRVEGLDSRHIRNAALAMHRGGVGYYHESDFVHLDTGKVRSW
jgi:uncharacterized protein YcbK (DUF882 family)